MSELKVGDKVWIPATAAIVFPSGEAWFTDHGGFNIDCVEEYVPSVPNLAAVARVIAAHPNLGTSLRIVAHDLWTEKYEDQFDQIFALANALNGGPE